jgi:hypothetical protein
MGRYLQAIKNEARKSLPAVIRGPDEARPSSPQPYYEERRPYDQGPPGEMTRADFQAALEQARRNERSEMIAHLNAAHHTHADRLAQVALAAVNKPSGGEMRYRGSAYDKRMRRGGELKFVLFCLTLLAALIFIFWIKDHIADYQAAQSAATTQQSHRHYRRSEEWDDR